MSYPYVVVLIINWNGRDHLSECLPSVLTSRYPNFKVTVIDNASVDGSKQFIDTYFPSVAVIQSDKNYGF